MGGDDTLRDLWADEEDMGLEAEVERAMRESSPFPSREEIERLAEVVGLACADTGLEFCRVDDPVTYLMVRFRCGGLEAYVGGNHVGVRRILPLHLLPGEDPFGDVVMPRETGSCVSASHADLADVRGWVRARLDEEIRAEPPR